MSKKTTAAEKIERRLRQLSGQILEDLGGQQSTSELQRQLARRGAALSVICDQLEPGALKGAEEPLAAYLRAATVLRRVFAALGEKQTKRVAAPTLSDYVAAKYGAADEGE